MCLYDSFMAQEDLSTTDLRDPRLWSEFGFLTIESSSGISVNPESALALGAYFDGIRIISEDIAKLPFLTYRRLQPRGKERDREHPAYRLLDEAPNENMSAMSFRETLTAHAIGWGGGFALIRRNGLGDPIELRPIHPSRVQVELSERGRLFYIVGNDDGTSSPVRQGNMFHVHGLSPDGMNGYSVARLGAESIGRGLAAEAFSASFFRAGSSPKGAIKTMRTFETDEAIERLRNQWDQRYAGQEGWHRPLVLEAGFEFQPITIPPEDAQLIETEQFAVIDICRWLRIAPHKLGALERATFSNIEEQNIDHVGDTLVPWGRRWEHEAQRKLFTDDPDHFAEHLYAALLAGNSDARAQFHTRLFNIGAESINDIRELENLNPVEGGDTHFVSGNLVRLEDAAEGRTQMNDDAPDGRIDGFDSRDDEDVEPSSSLREFAYFMTLDVVARCHAKERRAVSRMSRRFSGDEFRYQVKNFYSTHRRQLEELLGTLAGGMTKLTGRELATEHVAELVTEYVATVVEAEDAAETFKAIDKAGSSLVDAFVNRLLGE